MFCTACGTFNAQGGRCCAHCGASLLASTVALPMVASWPPVPPKAIRAILCIIPILTVLALVGAAGTRYQQTREARATSYALAEQALEAGDYDGALRGFAGASGFRDADRRYDALQEMLQPYHLSYVEGVTAFESRRYGDAIAALSPIARDLPHYEGVKELLAEAQDRLDAERLGAVLTAERRRDWLAAEQALTILVAGHPEDAALAERLRVLRQTHAPLAVARDDGLYLVGPNGADQRLLTHAVPAAMPTWDPARTRIAFLSTDPSRTDPAADLYIVSGEGNGLTKLATGLIPGAAPAWSADGDRIAYSRTGGGIGIVDVESGIEVVLRDDISGTVVSPTWSPDGQMLAVIHLTTGEQGRPASDVLIVSVDSDTVTTLPGGPIPDAAALAWNPIDHRLLVYRARLDAMPGSQTSGIVVVDLDTGEQEQITHGARLVLPPVWSPDGTRLAYVEDDSTIRIRRPGTLGEAVITVAHPLSGDLIWAPGGVALLALAAQPVHPSFLIPLTTRTGRDGPGSASAAELGDVIGNGDNGPPAWSGTHLSTFTPLPGTEES
jgi:hypothetical protein